MSLDGKIATRERTFLPLGSRSDLKEMLRLRRGVQAVIVGASTLRPYKKSSLSGSGPRQPINAVVSSSLSGLSPSWPFFKDKRIRRLLFTTTRAPTVKRSLFSKSCEVIVMGKGISPARILRELSKRGVKRVIVEGGGTLMWHFASGNLIDEYHVTLTPRILGGSQAPTLVDGPGFSAARTLRLRLHTARRRGEELYLVYRKTTKRGVSR